VQGRSPAGVLGVSPNTLSLILALGERKYSNMVLGFQPYIEIWDGHAMVVRMFDGANVCRMEEALNWRELEEEAIAVTKTAEPQLGGVFYPCPPELAEKAHFLRDTDEWITLSEAHRIAGVSREEMKEAIDSGQLTAKLDGEGVSKRDRQRVRRTRVLEMWPHTKTASNWCGKVRAVKKTANGAGETVRNERFWDKVDMRANDEDSTDQCWPWMGGRTGRGYGTFWDDGMARAAHKVAYELSTGEVPDGKYVHHTCDNVLCMNPAHLDLKDTKC